MLQAKLLQNNFAGRRNLFDKNNANLINAYLSAAGVILAAASNRMAWIRCRPARNYTVQRSIANGITIQAACCAQVPDYNVTTSGRVVTESAESLSLSLTSGPKDTYLCVRIWADVATLTLEQTLDTISIYEEE